MYIHACERSAASERLNGFWTGFVRQRRLNKMKTDRTQRTVVHMERVAGKGLDGCSERAGENHIACAQRLIVWSDLVGKPRNTGCRMIQHGSGQTAFFDCTVLVKQRADPAQIHVERTHGPPAQDNGC